MIWSVSSNTSASPSRTFRSLRRNTTPSRFLPSFHRFERFRVLNRRPKTREVVRPSQSRPRPRISLRAGQDVPRGARINRRLSGRLKRLPPRPQPLPAGNPGRRRSVAVLAAPRAARTSQRLKEKHERLRPRQLPDAKGDARKEAKTSRRSNERPGKRRLQQLRKAKGAEGPKAAKIPPERQRKLRSEQKENLRKIQCD